MKEEKTLPLFGEITEPANTREEKETLPLGLAVEIAERLANIPGFCGRAGALKGLTGLLRKLCRGFDLAGRHWTPEEQAIWLGDEASEQWNEWASEAELKRMFEAKFRPNYRSGNTAQDLGKKPPVICRLCNDLGTVKQSNECHVWCICQQGEALRQEIPGWLESLNRHEAGATSQSMSTPSAGVRFAVHRESSDHAKEAQPLIL